MQWKEFYLSDIFNEIRRGKRLKKGDHINGTIPYVSSSASNNGIDAFVGNDEGVRVYSSCLSIANSGSVGSTFYQPFAFVASDHVTKLKNSAFSKNLYLYISVVAKRLTEKYSFNRELNDKRIKREKILLPVDESGQPDYVFMEQYMSSLERQKLDDYYTYASQRLKELSGYDDVVSLNDIEWGEFFISDVAEILPGRDIYNAERVIGDTPYVSATANRNGIGHFISNTNASFESGCLSVNRNGSVGFAFYHPYSALFSNDCRKLRLKHKNKYVGIFVAQQITNQKDKYGYGYKMGTARLKRQKIMLPSTSLGQPDYHYMEHYMRRLEYQKLKDYLDYKNS